MLIKQIGLQQVERSISGPLWTEPQIVVALMEHN